MAILKSFQNSEILAKTAAFHFIECAQEAIDDHGYFAVALAGGSTPLATYEVLATVEFAAHINWDKVHVFWSDERCVGPNHAESNYRTAFNVMLSHSPISVNQIYRIKGEVEPKKAAKVYENQIQTFFGGKSPRFRPDILGSRDRWTYRIPLSGHEGLNESKRWVIENYVSNLSTWRLTMTAKLINQAANVTFLISGKEKAEIVQRVLAGRYTPEELPAQMIRPDQGQLRWFMDLEASELI